MTCPSSGRRLGLAAATSLTLLLAGRAAAAKPCFTSSDCSTEDIVFCVDNVCCDTKCDGPCEACSTANKKSGPDGVCGPAKEGFVCAYGHCDGDTFSAIGNSKCTADGQCVAPAPLGCLHDDPCRLDLCSDTCEQVTKPDGEPCDEQGSTCQNAVCSPPGVSTSSSAGAGGGGGAGGAGASSGSSGVASSSSVGAGGGGGGAAASSSSSAGASVYPPALPASGCGCVTAGREEGALSSLGVGALVVGLAGASRRRRGGGSRRGSDLAG